MTNSDNSRAPERASMLAFVIDLPNSMTLAGLCCGILGIYFAIQNNFPAAMIAMLWAVLLDWYDGPVARRIPGRSDELKAFGGKLDSLADIVSLGICPAIILLSYGDFNPWFLPGALAVIMAGVIRLAYFDVFGVDADGCIAGLSLDITALVVAALFVFEGVSNHNAFAVVLYGVVVVLAILHIAPFRMTKMVGYWYPAVTIYVLGLTVIFGWQMLS
ncbi:MAG TPA: CDP-alcohol phosphatidyltransferase [Nitrospirales bacterium]|nr:CDP-alcohol phosphatidyltransferase [Nitrospirales bacterium]HIA14010.1 CDP-alcohol phosphatidyltransferase [Nitrospirales bacterium]HIB55061.1 CDP-alcohol phosphatidyltransferase [Nitrospirales bacterium]HIC04523.1 CDP-alcohol phosphatidyltransferase [Nitrospirales bacterium]HIO21545.1 CDP-alcohol phosphatidyltransferase [Nitrospirales bacterium]